MPSQKLKDLSSERGLSVKNGLEEATQIWGWGGKEDQMTSRSPRCPLPEEAGLVGFLS